MTDDKRLIDVPEGTHFMAIRDEYVGITGSGCAAALLDYFEQMTLWRTAQGYADAGWVYASTRELPAKLRHLWGESTVKRELRVLVAKNLIAMRRQGNASAPAEYYFMCEVVQAAVNDWSQRDESDAPVRQKQRTGEVNITHGRDEINAPEGQKQRTGGMDLTHGRDESDAPDPLDSSKDSLLESIGLEPSSSSSVVAPALEMQSDDDDDTQSPDHPIEDFSQPPKTVYQLYAEEIGDLTPMLRDRLVDAVGDYGEAAVRAAIRAATTHNARHWAYIDRCLKNGTGGKRAAADADKWTSGEYGAFVQT